MKERRRRRRRRRKWCESAIGNVLIKETQKQIRRRRHSRVFKCLSPLFSPDKRNNPKKKNRFSFEEKAKRTNLNFVVLLLSGGFPTQSLGGQPAVDLKFDYYSPVHSLMCWLSVAVVVVVVVVIRRMTCSVFRSVSFLYPHKRIVCHPMVDVACC